MVREGSRSRLRRWTATSARSARAASSVRLGHAHPLLLLARRGPDCDRGQRAYGCSRARRMNGCANRLQVPIERVEDAVLNSIIDQVLTDTVVQAIVDRVIGRLAPGGLSRTAGELRTALQGVEREIRRVTEAIAKGGELESLLDKLR